MREYVCPSLEIVELKATDIVSVDYAIVPDGEDVQWSSSWNIPNN